MGFRVLVRGSKMGGCRGFRLLLGVADCVQNGGCGGLRGGCVEVCPKAQHLGVKSIYRSSLVPPGRNKRCQGVLIG